MFTREKLVASAAHADAYWRNLVPPPVGICKAVVLSCLLEDKAAAAQDTLRRWNVFNNLQGL